MPQLAQSMTAHTASRRRTRSICSREPAPTGIPLEHTLFNAEPIGQKEPPWAPGATSTARLDKWRQLASHPTGHRRFLRLLIDGPFAYQLCFVHDGKAQILLFLPQQNLATRGSALMFETISSRIDQTTTWRLGRSATRWR
jgi:hypothetical protein